MRQGIARAKMSFHYISADVGMFPIFEGEEYEGQIDENGDFHMILPVETPTETKEVKIHIPASTTRFEIFETFEADTKP